MQTRAYGNTGQQLSIIAFAGIVVKEETAVGLTVLQAGGISHLVLRRDITSLRGTGQSMMPEGLIAGMTQQDVADLLEFLVRLRR